MDQAPGNPERLVVLPADRAEQQDAEALTQRGRGSDARLEESIARYEAVLDSTLDPIITIDSHGIIQSVSRSAERVFGWTPKELVGQNVRVLMPEPHRSKHDDHLAAYRQSGQTSILGRTREFEAARKDGSRVPIELSVSRVDVPGLRHPLFTGIVHDITERKQAEAAMREAEARHRDHLEEMITNRTAELEAAHEKLRLADRLASIGTLAAGLGHDMNNVLLSVRCHLDAVSARGVPSKAVKHLDAVRSSAKYLQQLADALHLLALSPDAAEAATESTDLRNWWDEIGLLLARGLPANVTLSADWPSDLRPVAISPHCLTQAALNLVVNAGEAIDTDGEVRVWAECSDGGQCVRLGVTDNGHGMTEDVKRHALDPFFTTKKRGLGTGLGLSLVQGVVHSAGGSVDIESTPGRGTTIILSIPAGADSAAGRSRDAGAVRTAAVCVRDERTAGLVTTLLESAGLEVERVQPGAIGRPDLWVTESTREVLDAAQQLAAESAPTIVVLGAETKEWKHLKAVMIEDPSDFEEIRAAIARAIEVAP